MTASDMTRQQRRTTRFTVLLLVVATVGLGIACVAIGQEILTLPYSREELAEIEARLPQLREEQKSLIAEVAAQKVELSNLRTKVEEAKAVTSRLPDLHAEETRARDGRDRLVREVGALTSDRDTLQRAVDQLTDQKKSLENEISALGGRIEAERKRLDEMRQALNEERTTHTQISDARAAEEQKLARVKTDLAKTDRLLESRRAEFKGLTAEEQSLRDQVEGLKEAGKELETGNRRETERLASLQEEIVAARTTLATVNGQRDRARDELARASAMVDVKNVQAEAVDARLLHLTGLEAKVRQQLRVMIVDLEAVEQK